MIRAIATVPLLLLFAAGATAQETARDIGPRDITLWGDSLAAGAGGDGVTVSSVAGSIFDEERAVLNLGIGGQTSTSIAARMNAIPTVLSLAGAAIPARGPAVVTQRSVTPITDQGESSFAGTLCGVPGALTATLDAPGVYRYRFERGAPGAIVPCPDGSVFAFAAAEEVRGLTAWLWLGRNGADPGRTVIDDIAAAVGSLGHDRFLVGSVLTGAEDGHDAVAAIRKLNAELAATYGEHFVDLEAELFQWAFDDDDYADVAAGITPGSQRSDGIHLNAAGYVNVAWAFADATIRLGF
jgi:lysophospholipase L1-like esterase